MIEHLFSKKAMWWALAGYGTAFLVMNGGNAGFLAGCVVMFLLGWFA